MNLQKFTQKSIEAIQNAQSLASDNHNSQVDQEHILMALVEQQDSLINELFKKMGVPSSFKDDLRKIISNKPKMMGAGLNQDGNIYVASDVNTMLESAEDIAKNMKDE